MQNMISKARGAQLTQPQMADSCPPRSSRVTSPMLLVALAVFFGACYILYLRTLQSKLVLFGEKSPAQMDPQVSLVMVSQNANLQILGLKSAPPRCTLKSLHLVLKGSNLLGVPLQSHLPKLRENSDSPGSSVSGKMTQSSQTLPNPCGKHQLQVPTLDTRWRPYAGLDPPSQALVLDRT